MLESLRLFTHQGPIGLSKRDSRTRKVEALNFLLIPKGHCSHSCQQTIIALGEIEVPSSGNVEG